MNEKTIYMKIPQNIVVSHPNIKLLDIGKFYGSDTRRVEKIKELPLDHIGKEDEKTYVYSILKIIELICETYPDTNIINLGENDFVIEYKKAKKKKVILEYVKAFFVALIIFFGSAFTIMTFNTDVSVEEVFDLTYLLIMGDSKAGGSILEIAYSIGLPIGMIVFFNHFSKLKVKKDPTPIQIEMRLYESDVNKTIIENSSREGETIDID